MSRHTALAAAVCLVLAACTQAPPPQPQDKKPAAAVTPTRQNPFLAASTLPFQAPPFDKIQDADYMPAFDAGMKQQLDEIKAIDDTADAPTFDNTFVPLEKSGEILDRVSRVFFGVVQADTNDARQKI